MLVRVQARKDRGRWRCGVFWPHQWVEADVDEKKLKALESDTELVVHRAENRNTSLPSVKDVQPDPDRKAPDPQPWGDRDLERRRQEAIALDAQQKAEDAAERKAHAAEQRADYESKPNDTQKKRR